MKIDDKCPNCEAGTLKAMAGIPIGDEPILVCSTAPLCNFYTKA